LFDKISFVTISFFVNGRCSGCSHYTKVKSCSFSALGDLESTKSYLCQECIDKVKKTIFKDQ